MAMGKINSLGVGSGVLSHDVIDKLREADEKAMIRPIERKMEKNIEQQTTLEEIKTLIATSRASAKILGDYSTYLGREATSSSKAVEANVTGGTPPQTIKIEVEQLAQGDINEFGMRFESRESTFSDNDVKLSFFTQGKKYDIDIKGGMTVGDVAQLITDETDGEVMGIMMKTGGSKPYQLMLNSKGMGDKSRIYFGTILQAKIPERDLDLNETDFNLTLLDKNGAEKTINIPFKTDGKTNNSLALKEAILDALRNNNDFKDLVDSSINIGLGEDGKNLIINDMRGYEIKIGGEKAGTLGFESLESKNEPLAQSSKQVKAGKLNGVINIGSVPLDLAKMTKEKNSSEDNAKIIAEAIENIAGMHAKTDGKGNLILTSEVGEIKISAGNDAGKNAITDIGLQAGTIQGYAKLQDSLFKIKNIQRGEDAHFTYNGARISRPSNEVDDVIAGISLKLKEQTDPGKPAIITISRDNEAIIEQVKEFVKSYNELIPKLNESTRFDEDTKIAGIFNGVSDIRTIRGNLNNIISYSEFKKDGILSLTNYGISLNDKGVMLLDESKLSNEINSNPTQTEEFFYGQDKVDSRGNDEHIDGVFNKIDKFFAGLVDGSNARLELFGSSLERDAKTLQKDKKSANELLDTRYDTMAQRFAAYDNQIAKTKNAFGSVQMMIDQSVAKK